MDNILNIEYQSLKKESLNFIDWEEGWDGYTASRILPNILEQIFNILDLCLEKKLPVPTLIPISDGSIEVRWFNKKNEAIIQQEEGETYFFLKDNKKFILIDKFLLNNDIPKLFCEKVIEYFTSEIDSKIGRLLFLRSIEDKWDGEDALSMTEEVFFKSFSLIKKIPSTKCGIFLELSGDLLLDFLISINGKYIYVIINKYGYEIYLDDDLYFKSNNVWLLCHKLKKILNN